MATSRPKFRWWVFHRLSSAEELSVISAAGCFLPEFIKCLNFSGIISGVIGLLIAVYISSNNSTHDFYGAIHLPGATCSRWINVLIEWWMRANIVGFHLALHTNKYCEADCGGVVLDGVTPGVSPPPNTWEYTMRDALSALQGWLSKLSSNWIVIKDTLQICLWESPTVESIMKNSKPRVLNWLLLLDACTALRLMCQRAHCNGENSSHILQF